MTKARAALSKRLVGELSPYSLIPVGEELSGVIFESFSENGFLLFQDAVRKILHVGFYDATCLEAFYEFCASPDRSRVPWLDCESLVEDDPDAPALPSTTTIIFLSNAILARLSSHVGTDGGL